MLGNWSLGDYFKNESIRWSFEFLTSKEGLGLDPKRLYITVFAGNESAPRDDESIALWQECFRGIGMEVHVDVPISEGGRIFTLADNWWGPAGKTGPCGPDTEIHYDTERGELTTANGFPDFESGRVVEIWNNVFMQYQLTANQVLEKLDQHVVDTGMGFERVAMLLQDTETVFDTDLFAGPMQVLADAVPEISLMSKRIVADHIRAAVMLIADGIVPGNKDRAYVLRRLIRRAVLHLGLLGPAANEVVAKLVASVVETYKEVFPVLVEVESVIRQTLGEEVVKFSRTIEQGKKRIEQLHSITGQDAFDLYQSFGFPLELTVEYAESRGLEVNREAFAQAFTEHQEKSRSASAGQFSSGLADHSEQTTKLHSATHLLHQALRNILGPEVQQRGSNITPERLRFDFSWGEKLTPEQLAAVELEVNAQIAANHPVTVAVQTPDEALQQGAIGLFGHRYGETVTVYTMGSYSKEICTGPHVANTGELGRFSIAREEAVSAGVRRIKAVLSERKNIHE
jgi:alanyl-tRNA synthetase